MVMTDDFEDEWHDETSGTTAPVLNKEAAAVVPIFGGAADDIVDFEDDIDSELKSLVAQESPQAAPPPPVPVVQPAARASPPPQRPPQEPRPQAPLPVVVGAGSASSSAQPPARQVQVQPQQDNFLTSFVGQRTLSDAAEAVQVLKANVDTFCTMTAPHAQVYASRMRPWAEFVILDIPDVAGLEVQRNVEENISYFAANYLVIMLVLMLIMIIAHPTYLLSVAFLVVVWGVYVAKGGLDPAWKPMLRGVELTSSHRLMVLYAGSLATIFVVIGETLLIFVGAAASLMVMHAALHPSSNRVQAAALAAAVAMAASQSGDDKA